jgi:glycosyltransferase involved in cell wall biosynthesis
MMFRRKQKRVLMIVESFARGGVERQILLLGEGLLQRRYDVRVFELTGVVPGQANFEAELKQLGIPLWNSTLFAGARSDAKDVEMPLAPFVSLLPANYLETCRALANAVADYAPDVVNGWSDIANVMGGFVAGTADVPCIVVGQRVLPPPFWYGEEPAALYRRAYRRLVRNPRVTFVNCSAGSAREYEKWLHLTPGTVRVVYNGVSPPFGRSGRSASAADCRARFGLPAHARVVGGLMRFAQEKDPWLWMHTAAVIAAARPDAAFLLGGYGHGTIADELLKKAKELELDGRLAMPGAIDELGPFYGAMDVFLLTSRTENLGNVLIEAQAAGVPVVAPAVGGVGETMRDGVTGRLVTNRSAQSLAAEVLDVLGDDRWRAQAAAKAPGFVARKFGQRRMVKETIAIYRNGCIKA